MSLISNNLQSGSFDFSKSTTGGPDDFIRAALEQMQEFEELEEESPPHSPPSNPPAASGNPPAASGNPPAGSASGNQPNNSAPNTPPANLQTLQSGNVSGDPPDNIDMPQGTTSTDIANGNGGRDGKMLNSLNDTKWKGTGLGDLAAQKYGFKDMKTMLADKSPAGAQATAKVLWAARASNHVKEQDGSPRPDNEQNADSLSATRHGDAFNGGTAAVFQNFVKDGKSIKDQTVFKTDRTHADGSGRSAAATVGLKIVHGLEKFYGIMCPPFKDVLKAAEDGAEKKSDKDRGDKNAVAQDNKNLKQDLNAKHILKDIGEWGAAAIPGVGEEIVAGEAVGRIVGGAAKAAGDAAKGSKSAEAAGAGSRGAEDTSKAAELKKLVQARLQSTSKFTDELIDNLFSSSFVKRMAGLPKDATLEEKKAFVAQQIREHAESVVKYLVKKAVKEAFKNDDNSDNSNSAQRQDNTTPQQRQSAELEELHNFLTLLNLQLMMESMQQSPTSNFSAMNNSMMGTMNEIMMVLRLEELLHGGGAQAA